MSRAAKTAAKAVKPAKAPAPAVHDEPAAHPIEGTLEDFSHEADRRRARVWWAGMTGRQRAFWRGEGKLDSLASAWMAFNSEVRYWSVYQLPQDTQPAPKPVIEPKDDPKFLRAALQECDSFSQSACAEIEATARGAKALLAVDAHAIVNVGRLLDVIVERALDLQNNINSTAEEGGANYKDEAERAFSSRIWAQHHALAKGGAA